MNTFQIVIISVLSAGFLWVWLTDAIDILKRKKGDGIMVQRNYYEAIIDEINTKLYEQEQCLKNVEDPDQKMEIRFRIAKMTIERQGYVQILKNLL